MMLGCFWQEGRMKLVKVKEAGLLARLMKS